MIASFDLGRLFMTRGVGDLAAERADFAGFVAESLARHRKGDWGDLGAEDRGRTS